MTIINLESLVLAVRLHHLTGTCLPMCRCYSQNNLMRTAEAVHQAQLASIARSRTADNLSPIPYPLLHCGSWTLWSGRIKVGWRNWIGTAWPDNL